MPGEGVKSPGAGITSGYEPPDMDSGYQTQVLQKSGKDY